MPFDLLAGCMSQVGGLFPGKPIHGTVRYPEDFRNLRERRLCLRA
jgi:hypothetical protein